MSDRIWMVRAGRSVFYVHDFIDGGFVGIHWNDLGELPVHLSGAQLTRAYDAYLAS